jgi:hypothetical protein
MAGGFAMTATLSIEMQRESENGAAFLLIA